MMETDRIGQSRRLRQGGEKFRSSQ